MAGRRCRQTLPGNLRGWPRQLACMRRPAPAPGGARPARRRDRGRLPVWVAGAGPSGISGDPGIQGPPPPGPALAATKRNLPGDQHSPWSGGGATVTLPPMPGPPHCRRSGSAGPCTPARAPCTDATGSRISDRSRCTELGRQLTESGGQHRGRPRPRTARPPPSRSGGGGENPDGHYWSLPVPPSPHKETDPRPGAITG